MRLSVRVKTNANSDNIIEYDEPNGIMVVRVQAKAHNNRANIALVKFLKGYFKKEVRIIAGKTSRNKVVEIG